jgi:amino acid transporter/nucleotide-binding universal stress UspA family protein
MSKFDTEVRLSREMSLMDVTLIGVGAMIGAGIFVLTGIAAGVAGPALIVAFALNGLVALLTAMSYAELGSCYHDAGGGYLWVKEGLPKWNGFLSGWMSWFAHAVACSLYALGFGAYFEHVLHEVGWSLPHWGFLSPQKLLAAGIAVIFGYINYRGASETGKIGNLVTMAKLVILAIFIGFGIELMIHRGSITESLTPFFANGFGGVIKAMGLTFIAFQGFEVISQCSEEVQAPRKNIPKAVFLSLMIVVPIYLLVALVSLSSVTPENMTSWDYLALHKETALVEVAQTFFSGGGVMLLFGGLISTMSALNATVYSSSRVAFAMGRDRNFPTFVSRVHAKKFTPHWAILLSLIIVVLMSVSLPIEDVASSADLMFLLLFLQVNLAMIRLRKKRPELDRGFVTPLFPWLSVLAIALLLFLAVYMFAYSPTAWLVTAAWVGVGLFVYYSYASHREVEHIRKVEALERIDRKDYRILVCVSSPVNIVSLANVAAAIARKNDGEIILLHVIEVDEGQPLLAGLEDRERVGPIMDQAEDIVATFGVPVRSIIQVAHRISQAIVQTALEEKCNFILIGRQKKQKFLERVFSSTIDTVIQEAPCEVAILHGKFTAENIDTLYIPSANSIHSKLAIELAPAFLGHFHCDLKVGTVLRPDLPPVEKKQRTEEIGKLIEDQKLPAKLEVLETDSVLRGVLRQARGADLIVMGGQSGDFIELLAGRSLTLEITEQTKCSVLWLKEYEERPSFWTSLFKS